VDLSKFDSGFFTLNLYNQNIVDIVENIVQSIAEYIKGKGLNIVYDTDVEEKIISCDPIKIERIMLNLISNAIKFSNPMGNIYVLMYSCKEIYQNTDKAVIHAAMANPITINPRTFIR